MSHSDTQRKLQSNLRWLRKSRSYSQTQMAAVIGVKQRAYASWEQGYATPGYDQLIAVSDHFKTTVDEMLRVDMSLYYKVEMTLSKLTIEK